MPKTARGLHYEVTDLRPAWARGNPANRPVVFHHGIGANLSIFDEWVPIIAAHRPVARYDMRGFGQSVVPPESHQWTITELIDDLLDVATSAFGTAAVHVMGESMGGTIVLAAASRHPGRIVSASMSNAAISGGQIGHAPGWRDEIKRIGIDGWSRRLLDMRFVPGGAPPEAVAWIAEVQGKSREHVVVGLGELLVATDLTKELATYKSPLLLMMPDRSPFVSLAQATALADIVPQTEIAVFPGAKHGLPISHGREAARTLHGFLERVEGGRLAPPRTKG